MFLFGIGILKEVLSLRVIALKQSGEPTIGSLSINYTIFQQAYCLF